MRSHLAIIKKYYLKKIIDGQKGIEARLTKTRRQPFGQIDVEDIIYFKQASGPVVATGRVAKIKAYENLNAEKINNIKELYNEDIQGDNTYWQSKCGCKYALLIWLKDIEKIAPVKISKKDMRAWVVLSKDVNYGLKY